MVKVSTVVSVHRRRSEGYGKLRKWESRVGPVAETETASLLRDAASCQVTDDHHDLDAESHGVVEYRLQVIVTAQKPG